MGRRILLIDVACGSTRPTIGFNGSARWKLLSLEENEVLPPLNIYPKAFAPSDRGIPLTVGVKKYNYKERWEEDSFNLCALQPTFDEEEKFVDYKMLPITSLSPNMDFIRRHKLIKNSHPCEWGNIFLPHSVPKGAGSNIFATDKWTRWINVEAAMEFAGEPECGGDTYH